MIKDKILEKLKSYYQNSYFNLAFYQYIDLETEFKEDNNIKKLFYITSKCEQFNYKHTNIYYKEKIYEINNFEHIIIYYLLQYTFNEFNKHKFINKYFYKLTGKFMNKVIPYNARPEIDKRKSSLFEICKDKNGILKYDVKLEQECLYCPDTSTDDIYFYFNYNYLNINFIKKKDIYTHNDVNILNHLIYYNRSFSITFEYFTYIIEYYNTNHIYNSKLQECIYTIIDRLLNTKNKDQYMNKCLPFCIQNASIEIINKLIFTRLLPYKFYQYINKYYIKKLINTYNNDFEILLKLSKYL